MNASRLARSFRTEIPVLVLGLIFGLGGLPARAQSPAAAYGFAGSVPSASLADPAGRTFNLGQSNGRPTVILVSAPNMSQGGIQQDWVNRLGALPGRVNFYLVEDMKQAFFRDMALADMKKDYTEGDRPVVLVDNDGSVRKQLGVPKGKTCVMIYNSRNQLVYVQVGNASPGAVQAVTQAVRGLAD